MEKTKEEKNNSSINNSTSSNIDYVEKIQRAKEPFKKEILKMQTKEEKLLYLNGQKQRYIMLKENSNNSYLISIMISFIFIISIILLFAKTQSSVFFTSMMFTMIIIAGIVWVMLMLTMKNTSTNYTIIIFALDDLREKVQGSISGGYDDISRLKDVITSIGTEIQDTKQQVKEGYSILEQRIRELNKH